MDTKKDMIKLTLLHGGKLTPREANARFNTKKLSTRIGELIRQGMPIKKKAIIDTNGKRTTLYWMDKASVQAPSIIED